MCDDYCKVRVGIHVHVYHNRLYTIVKTICIMHVINGFHRRATTKGKISERRKVVTVVEAKVLKVWMSANDC